MVDFQQSGRDNARTTASLNKVLLIGNLGAEPEMRFTPNGNPVTTFRIATNRVYNSADGERKEETEWFSIVTWGRLAENCNRFLAKGQKIYVEGRLHTRSWDGNDGQKRFKTEVVANNVIFLDKKSAGTDFEDKVESDDTGGDVEPDDIPF